MLEYSWVEDIHKPIVVDALSLLLRDSSKYYPNMLNWLYSKVKTDIPYITRDICIVKNNDVIVGVTIVTSKSGKCKISTLYVDESYREIGIANRLLQMALSKCKTDPIITIAEPVLPVYKNIMKTFRFKLQDIVPDKYKKGIIEYVYTIPK